MNTIKWRPYSWQSVKAIFGPDGAIDQSGSEAWGEWIKKIFWALDGDDESRYFPRSYSISGGIDVGNLSGSFLNIPLEELPVALSAGDLLSEPESGDDDGDRFAQVTVFFVRTGPAHVLIGIGPPPDLFANGLEDFVGSFWPIS